MSLNGFIFSCILIIVFTILFISNIYNISLINLKYRFQNKNKKEYRTNQIISIENINMKIISKGYSGSNKDFGFYINLENGEKKAKIRGFCYYKLELNSYINMQLIRYIENEIEKEVVDFATIIDCEHIYIYPKRNMYD